MTISIFTDFSDFVNSFGKKFFLGLFVGLLGCGAEGQRSRGESE